MGTAHPNTLAAGLSGGASTLIVYLLNKYAGTNLDAQAGAAIATAVASVVLFIGRRGIRGTLSDIWNGNSKPKPAAKAPASKTPPV
jgi:hypothetical protein